MGLTNDERNSLVKLRMDKAKRLLDEAEQMYAMQLFVSTYSYRNIRCFWNELCKNK